MSDTHGVAKLPPPVEDAIRCFQLYIRKEYQARSARWLSARDLIQEIAELILSALGVRELPVDPRPIAESMDIRLEVRKQAHAISAGHLVPANYGFAVIVFDTGGVDAPLTTRARLTIAHECGHALFFNRSAGQIPSPIIPRSTQANNIDTRREEGLCFDFARALLMPKPLASFESIVPSVETLFTKARAFQVSPETLIRRVLYDFKAWRSVAFLKIDLAPTITGVQVFRGFDRRKDTSVPSGPQLLRMLSGKDLHGVFKTLQTEYSLSAGSARTLGKQLWVSLDR